MEELRVIEFIPKGVCTQKISIKIEGDIIRDIVFTAGCSGNTQGVSALAKGMTICEVVSRLEGIDCKGKGTSCPDQLARALKTHIINANIL